MKNYLLIASGIRALWRVAGVFVAAVAFVPAAFSAITSTGEVVSALPASAATVPGVIINYSPTESGQYLGSPSIAILPNGAYVASHDFFGKKSTQRVTAIFSSADKGVTWRHLTNIDGQWWSGLFMHQGSLYLMGNRNWLGDVVIRRSLDGGRTWTEPADGQSGLLLPGRYHTSAVPLVVHQGRIWRAMENSQFVGEKRDWQTSALMMSAPVDSDLLKAASWRVSDEIVSPAGYNNWREGNAVATPEGEMIDLIRIHLGDDKASMIHVSADGKHLTYDPARDLIDLPGGATKYTIRFDEKSGLYWSLVNKAKNPAAGRNLLALVSSRDLRHWDARATLLFHEDRKGRAFQYADWLFESDDIVFVSRTAWEGAHNAHDSNYITFHRVADFRKR